VAYRLFSSAGATVMNSSGQAAARQVSVVRLTPFRFGEP